MTNIEFKITEFTVSHNFETHRSGSKASHFVSIKILPSESLSLENFPIAQLQAKLAVGKACIIDAMASGDLTIEEARERIQILKDNIENIEKVSKEVSGEKLEKEPEIPNSLM